MKRIDAIVWIILATLIMTVPMLGAAVIYTVGNKIVGFVIGVAGITTYISLIFDIAYECGKEEILERLREE